MDDGKNGAERELEADVEQLARIPEENNDGGEPKRIIPIRPDLQHPCQEVHHCHDGCPYNRRLAPRDRHIEEKPGRNDNRAEDFRQPEKVVQEHEHHRDNSDVRSGNREDVRNA